MASQGLCDAVDLAAGGDIAGAEAAFMDRVHGFLHEFADRLSATDRQATAGLLEAKQRVEAVLEEPSAGASEVGQVLPALQDELDDAAEAAGMAPQPCAEGG
ncbi:MAG: hypothetical protein ACRDKA_13835 [Actinomycetota bacterium]